MAEKAAHLTATIHPKPSIFEIIAQESLNSTIHPALEKILLFLSSYNPRKYGWLSDYTDEIYLILNGFIQYHYIKKYGASFSEYFYGLKRVPLGDKFQNLSRIQFRWSIIVLVILPYLKYKLEQKLTQYRYEIADNLVYSNWKRKWKKVLCGTHGFLHFSWTFWTLAYYLRYMGGKLEVQTPKLNMLGLKLTYAAPVEEQNGFWTEIIGGKLSFPQLLTGLFGTILTNSLEYGAFFVQFLQSWQSEKSNFDMTALPVPEPPKYDPKSADYRGKCPLCYQIWKVPTVVAVSGYVYCFRCIVRHLQESNTCPVTKLPAKMADIVRIYTDY